MSITYTIPGATPLNQLSEATQDGQPDENARNNCVAASLAEGLHILTGATFDGDQLKDAVYGQGYTGVMAASAFVAYCAARGVTLSEYSATQAELVAAIHREVAAGHPVIVTMPSQWGTAPTDPIHPSGYTHVGCMVGAGDGMLRCMNPWGGFWQDESDEWWQARLCYGAVWVMRKAGTGGTGTMSIVRNADGSATDSSNGLHVGGGIAAYIFAHNLEGANLLTGEVAFTNGGQQQAAVALSTGAVVRWYGSGADENAAAVMCGLMGELANAQAATKSMQDANNALNTTRATLQSQLTDARGQIETLQAQLSAAQAAEKATSAPPAPPQPTTPPAPVVAPAPPVSASGAASSASTPSVSQGASIMNIFQKAWQGVSMTPQERALLRLVEGWLWAGLLAALGVVVTLISSGHLAINQQTFALILGAGFAAIMSAVKKYVSAHGDLLNSLSSQGNPPQN